MEKYNYKISREMYRNIKHKMTPEDISRFLSNVFEEGQKSAMKNTKSVSIEKIHNEISKISGIGEARLKKIDEAITKVFSEE